MKKLLIFLILLLCPLQVEALDIIQKADYYSQFLNEEKLGIGGGGMLYSPSISPFDSNTMMVTADMGGIYVSHNAGISWDRKNLKGTAHKTYFDPNREGVLYAGGSGLYRSVDNGENFELIFPKNEDIIKRTYKGESGTQYLFNTAGYPTYKMVKDILVNPNNSDNIFVLMYYGKLGAIYESTDNGKTFDVITEYNKETFNSSFYSDYNELLYDKEENIIYYSTNDGIYRHDNTKVCDKKIIDAVTVYENNETYFLAIYENPELDGYKTGVFITTDFVTYQDITLDITKDLPNTFDYNNYNNISFDWNFNLIDATSLDNIYVTQKGSVDGYPYAIAGIIHYNGRNGDWIYGHPFKDQNSVDDNNQKILTKGWNDGNYVAYGIKIDPNNENAILYTTLVGVYYSLDSVHFNARYTTVIDTEDGKHYVTNGIDEQNTYGVMVDPFNSNNLLLLNTDLGLIRSTDNGVSWVVSNSGVKSTWKNTIYDAYFDSNHEGVVYALWAWRHDIPYAPGNETDNRAGGFARSTDGGVHWDCSYSSGIPEDATPVKMSVVQNDNQELTIYVATFNHGFYVSYDSGRNFTEINNGIEKVSYKNEDGYQYILGADIIASEGKVFALTARSAYAKEYNENSVQINDNFVQKGEVFELIDGVWEKLELPENVHIPRKLYYKDGVLYICATTINVYDYKITDVDFSVYGGGLYTYQNGLVKQIFDEEISVTGVEIDSKKTMYISDTNGNIYRKKINGNYEKIYDSYHSISKGIQLYDDDTLYLASFGGGLLRLTGLKNLDYVNSTSGSSIKIDKETGVITIDKNDLQAKQDIYIIEDKKVPKTGDNILCLVILLISVGGLLILDRKVKIK